MSFLPIVALFAIIYWLSNRLSRPAPQPYVEPKYRGISMEKLIELGDSCDLLVIGQIENLENIDVERNVMGAKHNLLEVHLDVRVEFPEEMKDDDAVINSCYFMQQGSRGENAKLSGLHPELNDTVCLGLFMRSEKNGVFYLGSNIPFYRIRNDDWMPYTRRNWIDIIPAEKPIIGDFTDSGSSIH